MKTISSPQLHWRGLCVSSALALLVTTAAVAPVSPVVAQSSTRTLGTGSALPLSPDAPDRYTVKRGDTLWDISKMYLSQPWYWPEIWYLNPQVANPHLIYPGDVLALVTVDGQQRLTVTERGPEGIAATTTRGNGVRLSPSVRSEPLSQAITAIPYNVIAAFVGRPSLLTTEEVENAPHIVEFRDKHAVAGAGDEAYVRGLKDDAVEGARYNIVHVAEAIKDPESKDLLGYRGAFVGSATVATPGEIAKLKINESAREALRGDKVFAEPYEIGSEFVPHAPASEVDGRIASVGESTLVGALQVVVINRGSNHGLEAGNVLGIFQQGEVVRDRFSDGRTANHMRSANMFGKKVKLPDERIGNVMIFKAYDRMSYALVMDSSRLVKPNDHVRNP